MQLKKGDGRDIMQSNAIFLVCNLLIKQIYPSVFAIVRRNCTQAASRAASWWVTLSIKGLKEDGTDRRTDRRTPDRYITLTARRDQRVITLYDNGIVSV